MTETPYLPAESVRVARQPLVGYLMVLSAAVLFAINGTVSKVVLESGLSATRLAEVRSVGSFLGYGLILLLINPGSLRVSRRELPLLALFGVFGVALVQWFFFASIRRLDIGITLVIEYLAPLLVALWARFVYKETVRRRLWVALILALSGLSLILDIWSGVTLDGVGVAFALGGAVTYAFYILLAEREVGRRNPISLSCYGFLFATILWSIAQPWWSFPVHVFGERVSLLGNLAGSQLPVWALMGWMIVLGSMAPFALIVGSLRHLPATRVGVVAMLEPVAASIVAYAWLGETLGTLELLGGAIVLVGILLAQSAR